MDSRPLQIPHNYGIDVLRVWMCFEVILNHFWDYAPSGNPILDFFNYFGGIAVPSFMFLSFLLCAHTLDSAELRRSDIEKRIRRLAIPILFWTIAYYILINAGYFVLGKGEPLTVADLLLQFIFGHTYNTPMWFINDMLLLTLTVIAINRLVPHDRLITANIILTVCSLLFCLSGLNYRCFGEMGFEIRYTIGRYFEMLPYVGLANIIYLSETRIPSGRTLKWSGAFLLLCCCTAWLLTYIDGSATFGYGAPYQYLMTVPLVLLMWIIPFGRMHTFIRRIISWIAHYTLGIYCIHIAVGIICNNLCSHFGFPQDTFTGCIVIFLVSLILSRMIALLPWVWAKSTVS